MNVCFEIAFDRETRKLGEFAYRKAIMNKERVQIKKCFPSSSVVALVHVSAFAKMSVWYVREMTLKMVSAAAPPPQTSYYISLYWMVLNGDELNVYKRARNKEQNMPFKELSETLNFTECCKTMEGNIIQWMNVHCLVKGL